MTFSIFLKDALKVLRVNRNRTILTVLGIVIGIAAVMVIMSVGAGAQSLILDQINSLGTDLVSVTPGYSDESGPPASVYGITVTTLKEKDVEALDRIPEVKYIASYVEGIANVQHENQQFDTKVVGTTASYLDVESVALSRGNFFEKGDEAGIARVAILGSQIAQDFFGDDDPLGKKIKIKKEIFKVIGIIEKRGAVGFENQDSLVVIPIGAAQKIIFGINHLDSIVMKAESEKDVSYIVAQVKDIMREQHEIDNPDKDDFTVYTTANFIKTLDNITDSLRFFLSMIAAVSLLVGGVGIMNIMLVSVNERTKEIGLRKAIGATKNNIQYQFLLESILVTSIGGVLGIVLGVLISAIIAAVAHYLGYSWGFTITLSSIIMGVTVSTVVGILFGWYPASKASKLDPVEALRYE